MWYGINRIVLALAVALGLLIAMAADSEVTSLDPYHPATFLPLVASRLHTVQFYVSDLIDASTAGFRERLRHERPRESLVP